MQCCVEDFHSKLQFYRIHLLYDEMRGITLITALVCCQLKILKSLQLYNGKNDQCTDNSKMEKGKHKLVSKTPLATKYDVTK